MGEDIKKVLSTIREMAKRLNVKIVIEKDSLPALQRRQYVIRFTMKRRWGGVKKYAYQSTIGNLVENVNQIERVGGKILGID